MHKRNYLYGWAAAAFTLMVLFMITACENPSGGDGKETPVSVSGTVNPSDLAALGLEPGKTAVLQFYDPQGEKIGEARITGDGTWSAEIPAEHKTSEIKVVLIVPTAEGERVFECGKITADTGGTPVIDVVIPGTANEYGITKSGTENGAIEVSRENALKGETITVSAVPASGYTVTGITVFRDDNNEGIPTTRTGANGWSFTMPAANVTVQVNFIPEDSPPETYTVTWKNYDGTVLETDTGLSAGLTPVYNGATPTRAADAQYTYTFTGWNPAIAAVSGNAEYTAVFSQTPKGDHTDYTVTWKNYDGTGLETDTGLSAGLAPVYDGATPARAADAQYTYTFTGWNPEIAAVSGNAEYTAVFSQTPKGDHTDYTVTWKNYDGTVLETDTGLSAGLTPVYNGATPTRAADAQYTYTFTGWEPEIAAVSGNAEYTAVFSQTPLSKIQITFTGTPTAETIDISPSDSPLNWSDNTTLTVTVDTSLDKWANGASFEWHLDGPVLTGADAADNAADSGVELHAQNYLPGTHTLSVKVTKDGLSYSKTIVFSIAP
jgi:hypothetical protein